MHNNERTTEFSPDLEQLSVEEVVNRMKHRPRNSGNISVGSQDFDEAFVEAGVDQGMSAEEWNRWWARLEAELKDLGRKERSFTETP